MSFNHFQFSPSFRNKIILISQQLIGEESYYPSEANTCLSKSYRKIVDNLKRKLGRRELVNRTGYAFNSEELFDFFTREPNSDNVLSGIEILCNHLDELSSNSDTQSNDQAIANTEINQLNSLFREENMPFQYESGKILRYDSLLIHEEAVKPALLLLNNPDYKGAEQEFLNAYEHYRQHRYKESLNEACKSLESTMKVICDKRGWRYSIKDGCKKLSDICFENNLIESRWKSASDSLRTLLQSGVPMVRNKLAGHGQGGTPTDISEYIVEYVLHMTASTIVFLIKSESDLKPEI